MFAIDALHDLIIIIHRRNISHIEKMNCNIFAFYEIILKLMGKYFQG